jgi:Peptidase family M28
MKKHSGYRRSIACTACFAALGILLTSLNACNHSLEARRSNVPLIPVSKERMRHDVEILTSISPPRNARNVDSLNKSADYILEEFRKTDCRIEIQQFHSKEKEYKNVVCSFGPQDTERIIIGAHYDVYGDQPGADDNASGVAGMLELARLIHELHPPLKYRTDFVAFTLEEPQFFRTRHMGSYMYAKALADAGVKVRSMIALEMIGYYSDKQGSQHYPLFFFRWFYPTKGNYIALVGKWGQSAVVENVRHLIVSASSVPVVSIAAPSILPGIDFSDHQNFWKFHYKACMVTDTAFFRNHNYHDPTDTIDTLDFDKMVEVAKGLYWAVINL